MTGAAGREPLTVLHVSQPTDGGVGKGVRDLVTDQLSRGWRVVVATRPESELGSFAEAVSCELIPWRAARSPRPRPSEARGLARAIRATQPTIVHLHSSKAGFVGRLVLRGRIPTAFQPHGWSFEATNGLLEQAVVRWERHATRWADAIVCVSEGERELGLERGIRGNFRVVPNGVDLSAFPRASGEDRWRARRLLELGDGPYVVCVGRLSRAKGQDVLIDAWPAVQARCPDAALALVGDGEDSERLRQRADESVLFAGHRGDVAAWLAAADVVAVPSRWEGMSLGMLEAMASGRCVVATDVSGASEALDGAGATVPAGDPRALANAIVERLLDPAKREEEGARAADRALRNYDLRHTLDRIAALYPDVVARRRGALAASGSSPV